MTEIEEDNSSQDDQDDNIGDEYDNGTRTHSEIVLYWLKTSSKRIKTFVAQGLGEIQELTNSSEWRHVPSKLNPADKATKISSFDFSSNELWLTGPPFLRKSQDQWSLGKTAFSPGRSDDSDKEFVNLTTIQKP
ncbi:uncharacterized protein [Drosophila suzukii]|uniref:Uncharacterized protein n=1 Tax=Drosophila suzukii TaxID=28584 RepID=A0ABM4TNB1_DROSZ